MTEPGVWSATRYTVLSVSAGVVLMGLGLLRGAADVALLGLPVLLAGLWGLGSTPRTPGTVRLTKAPAAPGRVSAVLELTTPPGSDVVVARVAVPHHGTLEAVVHVPHERRLTLTAPTSRTGPHPPYRATTLALGPLGGRTDDPRTATGEPSLVLPAPTALRGIPVPHALRGLVGPHTARRGGDGTELRDIAPFTPGDRLRRIDWRATARRSPTLQTLYVRRTLATAEATVLLLVDSRDDLSPDPADSGMPTPTRREQGSLDHARDAAASVAAHALDRGDRVGLEELSRYRRPVPPGSGRRHRRRILHALAHTTAHGEAEPRRRAPHLPTGAYVYLFSTFMDDTALTHALTWRAAGHQVVAVDTLPRLSTDHLPPHVATAWRIIRLERANRLRTLARHDITVTAWAPDRDDAPPPATAQLQAAGRRRTR
ncbi:Uncharacterized conserved protein, DUF58 family, contains vWF domain [Paraoerskovia marina]|uniref:Uncharacterized conserved protein, DUF58 family, contains vWF domain n=1 Tax=Paraoerskovia marina TaxID=545619 RepID=A0A1H1SXK9_9CELL|nr:DUF58 domain-containing protein [Paraoerskovia marina]SDS52712.1 Uncharacterized conserved protein, DUF58 family, contains vWF domain [Paraoerskovia marina]